MEKPNKLFQDSTAGTDTAGATSTPVVIRLATTEDAAQVQAIYGPYVRDTTISFELEPPSVDEMRQRIGGTLPKLPWLVCEQEGRIAGYAYASRHSARASYDWSVNVSVYIHPAWHRRGVGRSLYDSLFATLRLLGYYNAYAGIALPNASSVGLHEAVGFRPIGVFREVGHKLGAWHDVGWWYLSLQPKSAAPVPPLSLEELKMTPWCPKVLQAGQTVALG